MIRAVELEQKARCHAMEHIEGLVPPNVEFICL